MFPPVETVPFLTTEQRSTWEFLWNFAVAWGIGVRMGRRRGNGVRQVRRKVALGCTVLALAIAGAAAAASCRPSDRTATPRHAETTSAAGVQRYRLTGRVLTVDVQGHRAVIDHDSIPGLMAAMTMSYPVKDSQALLQLVPGQHITADSVVTADTCGSSTSSSSPRRPDRRHGEENQTPWCLCTRGAYSGVLLSWSRRKRERPEEAGRARRAFEEFLSEHLDAVYAYALRLSGGRAADAEDLLQDAMLRAFGGLAELRAPEAARGWLFTILTRTHLNRVRAARRRGEVAFADLDDAEFERALEEGRPANTPEDIFGHQQLRERLARALDALAPELRTVVWLSDVEGFRQREVAAILHIPEGTVASRLYRARRDLRERLGDELRDQARGREA